jgi:hypothetical protein
MKKGLVRKFQDLSAPILGQEKTRKLTFRVRRLDKVRFQTESFEQLD